MRVILIVSFIALSALSARAQVASPKINLFPEGTLLRGDIPYANDTLKKHLLDIYLPPTGKKSYPVVIWIHGGAWKSNDKYADMDYMRHTVKAFIDSGYALASIDYRWSTMAPFPAQIQDCNQAVEFLYQNAAKYHLDKDKFALIGFSAGGHLANLLGLTNNNNIPAFYHAGKKPHFKIKLVLDFYGPADFLTMKGDNLKDPKDPTNLLLGAMVTERPDLAKNVSPVTYIDKNDPPFLIVQGERDQSVDPKQSIELSNKLEGAGIKNDLIIVPGAPHFGVMFDADSIRQKIFSYLSDYLK